MSHLIILRRTCSIISSSIRKLSAVNIPVVKEATALGCAIAAGVGAGIFSSMAETGERLVRWERTHTPDPEKHELYQDSRDKWQAVYQDQLGLVDHGLTTSLWKAPGL